MWRYIRQSLAEKQKHSHRVSSDQAAIDYDEIEDRHLETLWDDLKSEKYHQVCEQCQTIFTIIKQDLADDFGEDLQTFTLFDDPNEDRREAYFEALRLYQFALRGRAKELILHTKNLRDIDANLESYAKLRQEIQKEISTVSYLLGENYDHEVFFLPSELEELDRLMHTHCEVLLKQEFFRQMQLVIEALGPLARKDFQNVTEPYKNLRELCHQCLHILTLMKESRFFSKDDTSLEDYEHDVHIYLQVLWYLAIKTDLNKIEKFLHPNTYSEGLDEFCQVFAAISLLEEVVPHLDEARQRGLSDKTATILLEDYAEYVETIITHEAEKNGRRGLHQLLETDRLLAEGAVPDDIQAIALVLPENKLERLKEMYAPLEDFQHSYQELIRNDAQIALQQKASQEFGKLLEQAARGIGLREEPGKPAEDSTPQPVRTAYRYEYDRGVIGPEPVVWVVPPQTGALSGNRFLHKEWVADLYEDWKNRQVLAYMQQIIERHTRIQEKTRYRIDFAIKLFKKSSFALRLGEHKRIAVPNPNGRALRPDAKVDQFLQALHDPAFARLFEALKVKYQSRDGVKLQRLRWEWFAERELPPDCFETPKYDYLKYINTHWQKKLDDHSRLLDQLLQNKRDNEDKDDDD
ncbi:hypothetical protein U27_06032 [Candidatus Vecturithrix granuli]|uniref:Uncharacterized protein n=1 Tax=Vecturithrix granuli TaxID=1499967 RepID=A0A081C3A1_VECG1|nr:hypothetical protein U27_06032 [Candidatus Vecturithrix granuli]